MQVQKFKSYFYEAESAYNDAEMLMEKLITFGGKAYPKFGNIVIMAGGAGSGKGFVLKNLVGIEGRTFDVDELKALASKSDLINKRVKSEFGADLKKLAGNLKDPDNVAKLHEIIGDALNLPNKRQQAFYASVLTSDPKRKPNIIFDVTLKDLRKLERITRQMDALGYPKRNIHIVWVVNDIEVAMQQNKKRSRTVPTEILMNTHRGVSSTMKDIVRMGDGLKRYMDGDIIFAFNKVKVDSEVVKSEKGGSYVKDADYVFVKRAGKSTTKAKDLSKQMLAKIKSYVPRDVDWEDMSL